ncbi:DUF642 domain-containing protein [Haloferula sp. A504]|uniref:DUF642 domain-containing protein n=1 Tax=Haloferula sp. A504 TaxID=3373601 RepID=UPI0031C24FFB|nr:DUF642 domain-containing protein [Verrucomicrobiaceae bacterium E54]
MLKSDPAARALYYEYADLNQSLVYRLSRLSPVDAARSLADIRLQVQSRRAVRLSIAAAAAVFVATLVALKLIFVPDPPIADYRVAPGSLYTLETVDSGEAAPVDGLHKGSVVNLTRGSFEVVLRNGNRGVVLAPSRFEVRSDNEIVLEEGTAWFEVTKDGRGLQVATQRLKVIDLGTAFGIRSIPGSDDEVHVFSGSVRVSSPLDAEQTLAAGEARSCGAAGNLMAIPVQADMFLTSLPEEGGEQFANGDFEAGARPDDADFGVSATEALLPGWNFGRDVSVALRSGTGKPGYGQGNGTILSSTADVQVGFRNAPPGYEVGTPDDSIWQTFGTVPLQQYEVSFEMGGFFASSGALEVTAAVYDGTATTGTPLARISESRVGQSPRDNGYNPPTRFTFTARSGRSTLVLTETSPQSDSCSPVIDNVTVVEVPE